MNRAACLPMALALGGCAAVDVLEGPSDAYAHAISAATHLTGSQEP